MVKKTLVFVLLFALDVPAMMGSDGRPIAISPERRQKIEAAISRFMTETKTPGISVAVVENAELAWSGGFGMADLENSVAATASTLYRLASISKPITSIAALELWERGKLDLDAPVQKYCPDFPEKPWPITTRQILGHLAGIRHYRHPEGDDRSQDDPEIGNTRHFDDPISGGLRFFKRDPLSAEPGTKFQYTTHGYTVAGCVIEGASGQKYVDFARGNVFRLSGMEQTQEDDRFRIVPRRTRFYHRNSDGIVLNADFLDSSYKIPGGGWLSSADEMARFEIALLKNIFMREETRSVMWTSLKTADGTSTGYSLGWALSTLDGVPVVLHGGGQQGASAFIMLAPSKKAGVVVFANMDNADVGAVAQELMRIVLSSTKPR